MGCEDWGVVQLAARLTLDQKVPGSSPGTPVKRPKLSAFLFAHIGGIHGRANRYYLNTAWFRPLQSSGRVATIRVGGVGLREPLGNKGIEIAPSSVATFVHAAESGQFSSCPEKRKCHCCLSIIVGGNLSSAS